MISFVGKKPHFEWYINANSYSTIFHFFNRGEKLIQIENLHDFPMMPNWGYLIENVSILLLRQSVLRLQKQTYIDSAQQFYFRFTQTCIGHERKHTSNRPTDHPSIVLISNTAEHWQLSSNTVSICMNIGMNIVAWQKLTAISSQSKCVQPSDWRTLCMSVCVSVRIWALKHQ